MSTKVEQSSNSGAVTSPASTATGVKISKIATKSGFLIPKNKLSGSLIPIFRGGKKGTGDASNEENEKRVQRKTKWGPDLTQDTAVKKGRALAYQTRVDQITEELRLEKLETGDNQDLLSTSQIQDHTSSGHQLKSQELEVLELERREAIGEILRLNPIYKAPADYKPLLKEAKVPIPVTEYAAHSFVGLIFGPANDTHKRLEKETGAKIHVYGTKADTGLEVQLTTSDGSDSHGAYNELHVRVSADTYEKVDAAVALIELLFTPVLGNPPVSMSSAAIVGDNVNDTAPSQGTPRTGMPSADQPHIGSGPVPQRNIFLHNGGTWFSVGATPTIPFSGLAAQANILPPLSSNPSQIPGTHFNHSTMTPTFGPRSYVSGGFNPVLQSPSLGPLGPQPPQVLQHPYIPQPPPLGHTGAPRNMLMRVSQPTSIQPNVRHPELLANYAKAAGTAPVVRPVITSLPQSSPLANFSDQPLIPTGWSKAPMDSTSLGPGNMMPEAPAVTVMWGHCPMASHPSSVSAAPPSNISPVPQPSASHSAGASVNRPTGLPFFNSNSHSQMGISPSLVPLAVAPSPAPMPFQVPSTSIAPIQSVMPQVPMANSSPNVVPGSASLSPAKSSATVLPVQSGLPISGSGGAVSFNPIKPPFMTGLRPQQPSSSDFTFQPHRPQNSEFEVANRPDIRPTLVHPNQSMLTPHVSQNPFMQPAIHNLRPPPNAHGFSRPNFGSQLMQPTAQSFLSFASGLSGLPGPPRHSSSSPPVPLIQPRNFNVTPPVVNAAGIPRAGGPLQFQQNYPSATRPQSFVPPNQQFDSNIPLNRPPSSASGAQQVYDPFYPTTVSRNPQLNSNRAVVQKQDSDPEYEDLMASVGVK